MRGSGIDSGDFEYGDFTCQKCDEHNWNATAYYDDWGNWILECDHCGCVHDRGNLNDKDDDYDN
jgi:hypothetical protein